MTEAKCDHCNELFEIKKIKSKKVGIYQGHDVRFNYFNCPSCKTKYFVGLKEKEYDRLLAEYKAIVKQTRFMKMNDRNIAEIDNRLRDDANKLQPELKARCDILRSLFKLK